MTALKKTILVILIIGLAFFIPPVSATIKQIPVGGTVFIGEQGLDVTASTGAASSSIGWWASGAAIATSSPDDTYAISDPTNFYVSPSVFGSRTGVWYTLPGKTVAFYVNDPNLAIRVEDTTLSVDVTNQWVPIDDEIRFRIDTNLVPISERTGAGAGTPITIKVQAPSGGVYSSLVNKAGTITSLVDIPVPNTPYYTASIWDTSQKAGYSPGTYSIWAECNVNSMKDNYGQTGKTISQTVTVLSQDHNPRITGVYVGTPTTQVTTKTPTTAKTTVPTPTITTAPVTTLPPTPVITATPVPVSFPSSPTPLPATTTPLPSPTTKAPGFLWLPAGISILILAALYNRKS